MNADNTDASITQPLIAHLLELRRRLLWSIGVTLAVFCALMPVSNDLFHLLAIPLLHHLPQGTSMLATDVASPFTTPFKLAFVVSIFICIPYLLYHIWAFISPGLYLREKSTVLPILASSIVLFYCGVAFAYLLVLPVIFHFFVNAVPVGVTYAPDIARYLDIVLGLFIAFGLAFEIPVAIVLLVLTGATTAAQLASKRPFVIVGCFVVAMILTPPDVLSQTLLALPMWGLYELGVVVSRWIEKSRPTASPAA